MFLIRFFNSVRNLHLVDDLLVMPQREREEDSLLVRT